MSENKSKRENSKFLSILSGISTLLFVGSTCYLMYNILKLNGIENLIRYILIGILTLICINVFFKRFKYRKNGKSFKYILFILFTLIIGFLELYVGSMIGKGVNIVDKMNKSYKTYTTSLISLNSNNVNLNNSKIGIISNNNDIEGYVLAEKIIKKEKINKNNLVKYEDYISMLNDLYNNKIDALFITGSYTDTYSSFDKFHNIKEDTNIITSYSKRMKKVTNEETNSNLKSITEPFSILLLGVDSENEDISKTSGLGDSIILVTFNPNKLDAVMFSIPRDTYVPISCFDNYKNKITHAASGGDSCMIKTVENFTGIDIDYYAKINFKGLVKIVDILGGITVDVPYSFCEQNSNRSFAKKDLQYVRKGIQTLNGEQALALSRNRKTHNICSKEWNQGVRNDFVRGQNQQKVINGIINKLKEIKDINALYNILDTVSMSIDTNLTRNQILGFYNIFKKIIINSSSLDSANNLINIQKTSLKGSDAMIYDKRSDLVLYNFIPSTSSLNEIINAMKINLELIDEEYDTSFSFSIDEPYKQRIIGENSNDGSNVTLLPNFVGKTRDYVSSFCNSKGIKVSFKNKDVGSSSGYFNNEVISQSLRANYNIEDIESTLEIVVANVKNNNKTDAKYEDDDLEDENGCKKNEELGADKKSCVCKHGYERVNGTCTKKKITCNENEELGADEVTCLCKQGYERVNGVCKIK